MKQTIRSKYWNPTHSERNGGFALPFALIFVAIISFIGVRAVGAAISVEKAGENLANASLAQSNAEQALEYCKRVAIDSVQLTGLIPTNDLSRVPELSEAIQSPEDAGARWKQKGNWADDSALLITPPSGSSAYAYAGSGRCIIDRLGEVGFLVTARGRSPEFKAGTLAQSAADIWLQGELFPVPPSDTN